MEIELIDQGEKSSRLMKIPELKITKQMLDKMWAETQKKKRQIDIMKLNRYN